MNLAIHGIEGKIIENKSYYSNPHEITGKCDFVMPNPIFNVKKIDFLDFVNHQAAKEIYKTFEMNEVADWEKVKLNTTETTSITRIWA